MAGVSAKVFNFAVLWYSSKSKPLFNSSQPYPEPCVVWTLNVS